MQLDDMLMLGDPRLYEISKPITIEELGDVGQWAEGLDSIILQVKQKYGFGRAVAAPQMGIQKRLVCVHIDQPVVMINPQLSDFSPDTFEVWDDCMSFPNLLVRVQRYKSCKLRYRDLEWNEHTWNLEDDMSELMQHEVDHLDGILATDRAIDSRSCKWKT